ncbi:alanine racemase [PVC group bacterium]|nr:alanine racemase [PVC group bacterium]
MHDQSLLRVNLSAIEQNCLAIRSHIGSHCKLCAVVKADGYGLGAIRIGKELAKHADMLAVYSADEAGALLAAGIETELLVLAPVYGVERFHPLYRGLINGNVHLVIHGEDQLEAVLQMAKRFGSAIKVQVKVDTGLRRGGCDVEEATHVLRKLFDDKRVILSGVMTHFSSAVHDQEMTKLQHRRFDEVILPLASKLPTNCLIHEANTAATVQWQWTHRNMVRVGLAWTGTVPPPIQGLDSFYPVVSWTTHLAHIRSVKKGEQVGYGGTWCASRDSVIGVVPVGYAAGYPTGVGDDGNQAGAFVNVLCQRMEKSIGDAPVIGAVCMDQIAVDLTDISSSKIRLGCGVELLSTRVCSKATLQNVSIAANVVPHAVISRISSSKVQRAYRYEVARTELPSNGIIATG